MSIQTAPKFLPKGTFLQNGKYQILSVLGQGGFGITYLAEHRIFGKVAIKELFLNSGSILCTRENTSHRQVIAHFEPEKFAQFKKRFEEEAKTLFSLRDIPGIVKVQEIFEENDTIYFSMEFLEGEKLDDYVKNRPFLSITEGLSIINALGKTLSEVHKYKVLHRDVNPSNVIITRSGKVVLIDFGIARSDIDSMAHEHTTIFSPSYSPPEQKVASERMGVFSDVYSLGATAYFVFTGMAPQDSNYRIVEGYRPPQYYKADLPQTINDAISRSLEYVIRERYNSVAAFLADLNAPQSAVVTVPQNVAEPFQPSHNSDENTRFVDNSDAETHIDNAPQPPVEPGSSSSDNTLIETLPQPKPPRRTFKWLQNRILWVSIAAFFFGLIFVAAYLFRPQPVVSPSPPSVPVNSDTTASKRSELENYRALLRRDSIEDNLVGVWRFQNILIVINRDHTADYSVGKKTESCAWRISDNAQSLPELMLDGRRNRYVLGIIDGLVRRKTRLELRRMNDGVLQNRQKLIFTRF